MKVSKPIKITIKTKNHSAHLYPMYRTKNRISRILKMKVYNQFSKIEKLSGNPKHKIKLENEGVQNILMNRYEACAGSTNWQISVRCSEQMVLIRN